MTSPKPSAEEMALLGLTATDSLPGGGPILTAVYFTGTHSSDSAGSGFVRELAKQLSCNLNTGTLNLRLPEPVRLENPRAVSLRGAAWEAVPVILNETVVGVHAWCADKHDDTFLEIVSPVKIADRLDLAPGRRIVVRVLNGAFLPRAV